MERHAQTVRIGRDLISLSEEGPVLLNPPQPYPLKYGPSSARYYVAPQICGLLERIARARYELRELLPNVPEQWYELEEQSRRLQEESGQAGIAIDSEEQILEPIAQSVWASTAIEGEEVAAQDVPIAIVGRYDRSQAAKGDRVERMKSTHSIYAAYVWALSRPFPLEGGRHISPDFILELHEKMFKAIKPESAGRYKAKTNRIQWGSQVVLEMLPPERVPEFIERLCDRFNSQMQLSESTGAYSRLLAIAEFIIDFLAIHPFADGNGRAARLLSTYLLERSGFHFARFYSMDTIIYERVSDYYNALFQSQRRWYEEDEDLSPWISFYLTAVFRQWVRAHELIRDRASSGSDSL